MKMAAVNIIQTFDEHEFPKSWFPDLDSKSYIIPVAHFNHIHANIMNHVDVSTGVLMPKDNCSIPTAQKIKEHDDTHKTVHSLFTKIKDHTAKEEVMVMMTQSRFSMYSSPVTAARASDRVRKTGHAPLEDIGYQKHNHSDLVIVNKSLGVVLGVVQSIHAADPSLTRNKLEESLTYLTKAARSVQEVVRTVPRVDKVAVHTTLVLTSITRAQLEWQLKQMQNLQKAVLEVACLCKDEMGSDKSLQYWWQACWRSGHLDWMESDVYRHLVASNIVATVYQWLKEDGATIRLWEAGVVAFEAKETFPASLQHAVCHVMEPLRCPGGAGGDEGHADKGGRCAAVRRGLAADGRTCRGTVTARLQRPPGTHQFWSMALWSECAKNIAARLKLLQVGEMDEGRQGLSTNDVFVLSNDMDCDVPDFDKRSPAPLINSLRDHRYNVRTLSHKSTRDEVMAVVKRDV